MTLKIKIQLWWIKAKAWLHTLLIFIIYLLTQPFIEIWKYILFVLHKGERLNHPRAWMQIFFILTLFCYLAKNMYAANTFGILLFITIIKWEWDKKDFISIHRERMLKKLMKLKKDEIKEQEGGLKKENGQNQKEPINK